MMRHLGIISTLLFCLVSPRFAQAVCDTPNLLIVLDKSGSMTNGNKSKKKNATDSTMTAMVSLMKISFASANIPAASATKSASKDLGLVVTLQPTSQMPPARSQPHLPAWISPHHLPWSTPKDAPVKTPPLLPLGLDCFSCSQYSHETADDDALGVFDTPL